MDKTISSTNGVEAPCSKRVLRVPSPNAMGLQYQIDTVGLYESQRGQKIVGCEKITRGQNG